MLKQPRTKDDLKFPDFEDIKVSTKTYTATTNLTINIKELFEYLPVVPYVVIAKRRGRKKKCELTDPNNNIPEGSIITIKCEGELRGVELKPKKLKNGLKKKWFRNSITVVIILDKPINFKICRNGTFQMTGCKTHEHAEQCIKYIWKYMNDKNGVTRKLPIDPKGDGQRPLDPKGDGQRPLYTFTRGTTLETLFIPSMRNIDFSIGFLVDREKLNRYMSTQDKFHCLLETSFGYTGVNIKIPLENDISTMDVKKLTCDVDGIWSDVWTTYQEYLDILNPKDRAIKLAAERYNTFLVFHSGKIIHSGLTENFMRDVYYYFLTIMRDCFDSVEERLDIIA